MITKFNQYTRGNYVEDSHNTVGLEKTTVVIYRAKCMQGIPEGLKDYIEDGISLSYNDGRGRKLLGGNADFGDWDAIMFKDINYDKKGNPTLAKVYVTAILRRPFNKEQQEHYEKLCALPLKERIYHPWDSNNDSK